MASRQNPKLATISRRLAREDQLPALPEILTRVKDVTSDRDSSASDLAEVILKDQALTGRILKVVNSPFYSRYDSQVTTVTEAIVVMGFENVRNISFAASAKAALAVALPTEIMTDFWSHALATGVCAQMLAREANLAVTEEAFVGGLLHDVGKLILARYYPAEYEKVFESVQAGKSFIKAEHRHIGVDHVEVGLELAKRWRFAPALSTLIGAHHDLDAIPPGDSTELPRLVYLANQLTTVLYRDWVQDRGPQLENVLLCSHTLIELPEQSIREVISVLKERIEEMAQCFGIRIGKLPDLPEGFAPAPAVVPQPTADLEGLRSEVARQQQWMTMMGRITEALVREEQAQPLLQLILDAATDGLGLQRAMLVLQDADPATRLRVALVAGKPQPPELLAFEVSLPGAGIMARTLREGTSQQILDCALPLYAHALSPTEREVLNTCALASVPVLLRGKTVGLLLADNSAEAGPITDSVLESLQLLANYLSLTLDQKS